MTPGLTLAINGCAEQSASLTVQIAQKANDVRNHKRNCEELSQQAHTIQALFEKHKGNISEIQALHDYMAILQDIVTFCDGAQSGSMLGPLFDVFFKRRYRELLERCRRVRDMFDLEIKVDTRSVLTNIIRDISDMRSDKRVLVDTLQELRNARGPQRGVLASALQFNAFVPPPEFMLDNPIDLNFDQATDIGYGSLEPYGRIVCRLLVDSGQTGEHLKAYQTLQNAAFVERFWGLLNLDDKIYAVLEDLSDAITLSQACIGERLPESMTDRIRLCLDLAKSVAWFHRGEILVKCLSDHNVRLVKEESASLYRPVLTKLETSRLMFQRTPTYRYDQRFEAPECSRLKSHNRYTDYWSLGVLFWQICTGKVPYGKTDAIYEVGQLGQGLPGVLNNDMPKAMQTLIQGCWRKEPWLRRTAAEAVNDLEDILSREDSSLMGREFPTSGLPLSALEETVLQRVQVARRRSSSANSRQRVIKPNHALLPEESLSLEEYRKLTSDDEPWSAARYFLIGAAIFWDLIRAKLDDLEGRDTISSMLYSEPERRAFLSLRFLQPAVNRGYVEAFEEASLAHSHIAQSLKQKYAKLGSKAGAVASGSAS